MGRGTDTIKLHKGKAAVILLCMIVGTVLVTTNWDKIDTWATNLSQDPIVEPPVTPPVEIPVVDTYTFKVYDVATGELLDTDNGTIVMYFDDISDLSAADLAEYESVYANFAVEEEIDLDESYRPDLDQCRYEAFFNSTVYGTTWVKNLHLGENTIIVAQTPASVAHMCFSDALDTTTLNTNNTNNIWNFKVVTLDSDNLVNDEMGYVPTYDFTSDSDVYFVLELQFNTTITKADVLSSPSGVEDLTKSAANLTLSYQYLNILGEETFVITFDAGEIGVDYDCIAATLWYGDDVVAIFA